MFTAIVLGLFIAGWLVLAFLPWLALSVATRGRAGLANLPLCLLAGMSGALAVPFAGATGAVGLAASFLVAAGASFAVLAVRRWARLPHPAASTAAGSPHGQP